MCESTKVTPKRKTLFGRTEVAVEFINSAIYGKNLKMEFGLRYKDKFRKQHNCKIYSNIEDESRFPNVYEIVEEK